MASSSSSVNKSRKRKHVVLPVESKIGILDRLKAVARVWDRKFDCWRYPEE